MIEENVTLIVEHAHVTKDSTVIIVNCKIAQTIALEKELAIKKKVCAFVKMAGRDMTVR